MGVETSRCSKLAQALKKARELDMDYQFLYTYIDKDVQIDDYLNGKTALYRCIEESRTELVNLLISVGCNVNKGLHQVSSWTSMFSEKDTLMKETPLHLAVRTNKVEIARTLLADPKSNIDVNKGYLRTPIRTAIESKNAEITTLLLSHPKININTTCGENKMPLMGMAALYGSDDVIQRLIELGSDVNATDNGHVTPLYIACKYGYTSVLKTLLKANADITIRKLSNCNSEIRHYPLHIASTHCHANIVNMLCQLPGCDVNVLTDIHRTALSIACQNSDIETVECLLESKADPNIPDEVGQTPLFYVIRRDAKTCQKQTNNLSGQKKCKHCASLTCIQMLIEAGANFNAVDKCGSFFTSHILRNGSIEQTVLILTYGPMITHTFLPTSVETWSRETLKKLDILTEIDNKFRKYIKYLLKNVNLKTQTHIVSRLKVMTQPRSLMSECRSVTRDMLCSRAGSLTDKVKKLQLPETLKSYLMLSDIYDEYCLKSKHS